MIDVIRIDAGAIERMDFEGFEYFHRYRRYPGFYSSRLQQLMKQEIRKALERGGDALLVREREEAVALGLMIPLHWDSDHFGIPMARLVVYSLVEASDGAIRLLVEGCLGWARAHGHLHISCEIDIDDYRGLNCLASLGFEVLDLRRTYCANKLRKDIDFIRMSNNVRPFQASDFGSVMQIVRQTHFPSRFGRDPHLPADKVASMYERWFEHLLSGGEGGVGSAAVYEKSGALVACAAVGEEKFSFDDGSVSLSTNSLYAGLASATGAYPPLIYWLISTSLQRHDLGEATVSMNNAVVCRVLEAFRSYKSASSSYSLRKVMSND